MNDASFLRALGASCPGRGRVLVCRVLARALSLPIKHENSPQGAWGTTNSVPYRVHLARCPHILGGVDSQTTILKSMNPCSASVCVGCTRTLCSTLMPSKLCTSLPSMGGGRCDGKETMGAMQNVLGLSGAGRLERSGKHQPDSAPEKPWHQTPQLLDRKRVGDCR